MKYILMMQFPLSDWKSKRIELWPPQDVKAHFDFLRRFNHELAAGGEFVRTEGLGGPESMKVMESSRPKSGVHLHVRVETAKYG